VPTGSIVVRERPTAAKVAHFRQMLRDGSKRPPIKIMKYPDVRWVRPPPMMVAL
jgi:hypothetical protein